MKRMLPAFAALFALALALACCEERTPSPRPQPATTPPATQPAPAPSTTPPAMPSITPPPPPAAGAPAEAGRLNVGTISVPIPEGWSEKPPANAMRLAELHIPAPAGATEGAVVVFSTAGGDIQSNLDRWAGQFSGGPPANFDTRTIAGLNVHTAEASGAFTGMSGETQENHGLRGAIIEAGPMLLFVKMTGPADQVQAAAPAFDAMLNGLKPLGP